MWNYQVVKNTTKIKGKKYTSYGIREIYFSGNGKMRAFTVDDMAPYGVTKEELLKDLVHMLMAFDKPVVTMTELNKMIKRRKNNDF